MKLLLFRIYINFVDMDGANVAWNSTTFGWRKGCMAAVSPPALLGDEQLGA